MKIFELNISSVWWFAAEDEWAATEMLREELRCREISDEDLDDCMSQLRVCEVNQDEASSIMIVDEYGSAMSSLWDSFENSIFPGILHTDLVEVL